MWKKHILLACALVLSASFIFAQNAGPVTHTEGIVQLKTYDPDVPSIVTDARGRFVFSRHDSQGNQSLSLWKSDPASGNWMEVDQENTGKEILSSITGQTDPTAIPLSSAVQAVYWKDDAGTIWCLSAIGIEKVAPGSLEEMWAGNERLVRAVDEQGNTVWQNKISVSLHYQ